MKKINRKDLVKKLKKWLGKDGIKFFKGVKKDYGKLNAVWMDGPIPHCVHFVEGMSVRNFLRQYVDWDPIKLDNEWVDLVEEAIK